MSVVVACVVEGHGEVQALPLLVRRLAAAVRPGAELTVPRPFRLPRGKFRAGEDLERAVLVAAHRVDRGGVLDVGDGDDDCPAELASRLRRHLEPRVHCPVGVVLAVREYESRFLAGVPSLRTHPDICDEAPAHEAPETVRDALRAEVERLTRG